MKKGFAFFLILLLPSLAKTQDLKTMDSMYSLRAGMVENQMKKRGILDEKVLNAFLQVPREHFVLPGWEKRAYEDNPLPIGEGQTISQPYIVALMTEALDIREGQKILEIGTGSGYQAAILNRLTKNVLSIEIRGVLTEFAINNLKKTRNPEVKVQTSDGYFGWKENAPFDAIIITCALNHIPPPLKNQLKIGGKMILPLGSTTYYQTLILITRTSPREFVSKEMADVRFVPMTGKALGQ